MKYIHDPPKSPLKRGTLKPATFFKAFPPLLRESKTVSHQFEKRYNPKSDFATLAIANNFSSHFFPTLLCCKYSVKEPHPFDCRCN